MVNAESFNYSEELIRKAHAPLVKEIVDQSLFGLKFAIRDFVGQ